MFRDPVNGIFDNIWHINYIAIVLFGLEHIRSAISRIGLAKVHATRNRPQRVDRAIALAIGERARFPPREVIVERLVFGIVFGKPFALARFKKRLELVRTHLARFHQRQEVVPLAQFAVHENQFKRFHRHRVMVATISACRPALDRARLLDKYSL